MPPLPAQAAQWQTPVADDQVDRVRGKINSRGEPKLSAQAIQWPTPAAQNWKGSSEASITRADGKSRMDILHYRAEQGFTHPGQVITQLGLRPSHHAPISRPLWASMIASHGRVACRRILKGRLRRRLHPLFVGWLMGWPIGHALCVCSATKRNQHGEQSTTVVVGIERVLHRRRWRSVEVLACPVTWRPHPEQIASPTSTVKPLNH